MVSTPKDDDICLLFSSSLVIGLSYIKRKAREQEHAERMET